MTLYNLTEEYRQLLELAEDPETDADILADTLEGLEGEIEMKAEGYAKVIRQIESDVSVIRAEEERLANRRRSMEGNVRRMKEALQAAMVLTGKTKIKTDLFSFNIQKNPAALKIDVDVQDIPKRFRIPQPDKVDTSAIKSCIKAGSSFDWCHLEQSEGLRIR